MGTSSARLLTVALGALVACAGPMLEVARPDDLPARVLFRTPTEDFNREWYVALRDGRIWVKPNPESGQFAGDWQLLGENGLPSGCGLVNFGPPERIAEISVDGIHLMALSDAGVFYRAENSTQDIRSWIQWEDRWGWPAGIGDGLTAEFSTERGWSVGDSNQLGVQYYTDVKGTRHDVRLGVAHIYRLDPAGRRIHYNDWWLPDDWSREICGPERGTFVAANISVSASTLFLIGTGGAMYTRLWDFDISGESDLLTYSYIHPGGDDNVRALPAEGWRRQPDVDGLVTRTIAIYQTGQGNAARGLRVEGERDGRSGFFFKNLEDPSWQFEETGAPLRAPFINDAAALATVEIAASDDTRLVGALRRENVKTELALEIVDFNLMCSPARVTLRHDGDVVTAGGVPLELPLHHVHAMQSARRPVSYWAQGMDAQIRGALLIPEAIRQIDDADARADVLELLGERQVVNLAGDASYDHVDLQEIPITTPFLVPLEEKGTPFYLFSLEASAK
ncbi:MAG: hypothetical protein JXR83_08055 [Deltaproteobacteria bacterium]|nr:hypothetical protein [Deltaproteobacteria bacterium]